jgi:hypothetical protein
LIKKLQLCYKKIKQEKLYMWLIILKLKSFVNDTEPV